MATVSDMRASPVIPSSVVLKVDFLLPAAL